MWDKLHESMREQKFLWLAISFLFGFLTIPMWFHLDMQQSWNTWTMPLASKVIVIDAGHGGIDGGAVSRDGLAEKEITLKVAAYLRDFLQQSGAYVVLTRESDMDLAGPGNGKSRWKARDLTQRLKLVTDENADLFVSIHGNAFPGKSRGAQTFYNPTREANKKLATYIQTEMVHNLENTNRVAKAKNDVYLLKYSPVPTALVEVGFLSNPVEAQLLRDEKYQRKIAASIYYGILAYHSDLTSPNP
ncbi:N-acetylmuramoyl-L-alanine amidase CwlD [Shimazuella kribbensis]|uniref:N-acetylmuramoyl-L-alanine amidase CwlD n=1 Tax=Shimazuella kribbensis TaxID=139808 RepID=UPI000415F328|nr:N-acetylmuramoyl-L-alanine amidase CwlD [Shimazuella kribbensis]